MGINEKRGINQVMKKNTKKSGSLADKVLKTKDLTAYQKGSIVSKAIIDRKTGTVTVFSFDKGQGLSEHVASFDAMVMILDGEAKIFINRIPFCVKAGEAIIMPANIPHSLQAKKKFKMMLVMIHK